MVLKGIFVKHPRASSAVCAAIAGLLAACSVLLAAAESMGLAISAAVLGFLYAVPLTCGFYGIQCGKHPKKSTVFAYGLLFGVCRTLPGYLWMYRMAGETWITLSAPVTVLLVSAAILLMALQMGCLFGCAMLILSLLWRRGAGQREVVIPPALAILSALTEYLQGISPWQLPVFGLPWLRSALAFTGVPLLLQSAVLGGSLLVGAIPVLFGAWVGFAIMETKKKRRFAATAAFLLLIALLGVDRLCLSLPIRETGEPVTAALVQGNLPSADKWSEAGAALAWERYETLTCQDADGLFSQTGAGVDLTIWPESAIPLTIERAPELDSALAALADRCDTVLLTGLFHRTDTDCYTSAYAYSPGGRRSAEPYSKQILVPFGEYVPGGDAIAERFPTLAVLNQFKDPLTAGASSEPLHTDAGDIGVLLCFDAAYDAPARKTTRAGAAYFACLSNTAWFADSAACRQMVGHAALRCAENGRPMLLCSSTGISAVLDAKGRILASGAPMETGVLFGTVSKTAGRTVFSFLGEHGIALIFLFSLLLLFIFPMKNAKSRPKTMKKRKKRS